jgi:hypothetical protein
VSVLYAISVGLGERSLCALHDPATGSFASPAGGAWQATPDPGDCGAVWAHPTEPRYLWMPGEVGPDFDATGEGVCEIGAAGVTCASRPGVHLVDWLTLPDAPIEVARAWLSAALAGDDAAAAALGTAEATAEVASRLAEVPRDELLARLAAADAASYDASVEAVREVAGKGRAVFFTDHDGGGDVFAVAIAVAKGRVVDVATADSQYE